MNNKSRNNKYILQKEGSVKFYIHQSDKDLIPSKSMNVFYNKNMEINRDITISSIITYKNLYNPDSLIIVDSMAASGITSIRLLQECNNIEKIYINDINPLANYLIKKNLELNRNLLNHVEVTNEDANSLFLKLGHPNELKKPNIILIDPFGTPSYFIDTASKAIQKKNGLLCITATDTAVLFGIRKNACIKKYLSKPLHNEYCKEIGARILLNFISKIANMNNLGIIPLLTFYSSHFLKIFALTYKGNKKIYSNLSNNGFILHCNDCGHRSIYPDDILKVPHQCPICNASKVLDYAGPLWIENLHDKIFVEGLIQYNLDSYFSNKNKINKILNLVLKEIEMPATYYNIHKLCEKLRVPQIPKIDLIIEKIRSQGAQASRTHFDFLSIKTNIGIKMLTELIRAM
ncbi:MAG: tRNA (guanine(10)-N(2))-dimethyltransferase [Candidatus Thorarchaeota archaeon]